MSNDNVIKSVTLSKRINNSCSNFEITFNTPLAPDEFTVGMPFELILTDGTQPDEFIAFSGIIETINRDETNNNRIYSVTGRNDGRLLTRQPFKFDCDSTSTTKYSYDYMIDLILTETGVSKGRGIAAIPEEV
jgi:hypothetical protein